MHAHAKFVQFVCLWFVRDIRRYTNVFWLIDWLTDWCYNILRSLTTRKVEIESRSLTNAAGSLYQDAVGTTPAYTYVVVYIRWTVSRWNSTKNSVTLTTRWILQPTESEVLLMLLLLLLMMMMMHQCCDTAATGAAECRAAASQRR